MLSIIRLLKNADEFERYLVKLFTTINYWLSLATQTFFNHVHLYPQTAFKAIAPSQHIQKTREHTSNTIFVQQPWYVLDLIMYS
jgi:hypothetical protein